MRSWFARPAAVAVLAFPSLVAGCGSDAEQVTRPELVATTGEALTGSSVASLALANVGGMACAKNSLGGTSFDSSCTGNGGQPEYWCADFARWVWEHTGAGNTSELTAAAGSFYVYGQNHGTLSNKPAVGDAVVFNYQGGGVADHVALVTQVNSDGTIETVSGDWNGQSGTEAQFSSTSHVVLNSPAYPGTVGSTPGIMGMTISGFIAPVGLTNAEYGATYVSQSFPLATTALQMFAGQTIHASIVMKNVGSKSWDSSTRLGTTQPRDRDSAFADSSWVSPNRAAAVKGTVAPGATFSFDFDLHAPSKTGTYLEYFNLVQENVAWFSDSGQGGPPDNDLEANIVVVPGVRGYLDGAECTAITGWTQDQATPDAPIAVDLYFDAKAGDPGATPTKATANANRSDLCKAIGSCVHGFSVVPPASIFDGKAHTVYAYGLAATGAGPNELLTGSPKTITCSGPPPSSDDAGAAGTGEDGGATQGGGAGGGSADQTDAGWAGNADTGASAGCAVSPAGDMRAGWCAWGALFAGLGLVARRKRSRAS
jgi:hypothetical protein